MPPQIRWLSLPLRSRKASYSTPARGPSWGEQQFHGRRRSLRSYIAHGGLFRLQQGIAITEEAIGCKTLICFFELQESPYLRDYQQSFGMPEIRIQYAYNCCSARFLDCKAGIRNARSRVLGRSPSSRLGRFRSASRGSWSLQGEAHVAGAPREDDLPLSQGKKHCRCGVYTINPNRLSGATADQRLRLRAPCHPQRPACSTVLVRGSGTTGTHEYLAITPPDVYRLHTLITNF